MPTYDYIIIGAGASGLLLADALGTDSFFSDKSILILDKSDKSNNDRTWCFWEKGIGSFDTLFFKAWSKVHFEGKELNIHPSISPYSYKMLRGIDFYQCYLAKVEGYPNIHFQKDEIEELQENDNQVIIKGKQGTYAAFQVFDSRFDYGKLKRESKHPVLQQHFLGWFVKTDQSVFDIETPSFMDFSIPQKGNTRFMYVLPFSENEALVEYTLFSEDVLEKGEYETAIKTYLKEKLDIDSFEITDLEHGNIPMTCHDFTKDNTKRILKIGTAGGWAKASTGYTFHSSVKKVKQLILHLKEGKKPSSFGKRNRFWYYDLLLLDILHKENSLGREIFESLFEKRTPQLIFKFLDEETNLWEDLKILTACPKWPFINALFKRLF